MHTVSDIAYTTADFPVDLILCFHVTGQCALFMVASGTGMRGADTLLHQQRGQNSGRRSSMQMWLGIFDIAVSYSRLAGG